MMGAIVCFGLASPVAHATFVGRNGRISMDELVQRPCGIVSRTRTLQLDGTEGELEPNDGRCEPRRFGATWSPGGGRVTFARRCCRRFNTDIWVMRENGENPTPVTTSPADDVDPT
jgi:hypothetical protein